MHLFFPFRSCSITERSNRSKGFTVLEVLIVVALFGFLATLAAVSLNTARARMRDAQRLSDVSQLRAVMSQYWLERNTYPTASGLFLGRPGDNADTLVGTGFVEASVATPPVYLERMPVGPSRNEWYRYSGGVNGYSLRFRTESDTSFGSANVYYAHANGIDVSDEEK